MRTIRLVPPWLSLQPDLFATDPARETLLAWLRQQHDRDTWIEDGTRTAGAAVRALTAADAGRVQLLGDGADAAVLAVLEHELLGAGVAFERVHAPAGPHTVPSTAFAVIREEPLHECLARLRKAILHQGTAAVRLLPPPVAPPVHLTRDLAALRPPLQRALLLALAAVLRPACLPLLQIAAQWSELAIDPLLQCWAGNGVADRNRDLVVNIAP